MLNTIWLIITALAFGGVVEKAGVLDRLITPVIDAAKSAGALVASLVAAVLGTNIVTADQYIAIVLPGRMFKNAFEKRGFAPVVLSRTVGASATPTSALIPWNSCGAYMAATLGRRHVELPAVRGVQLCEPASRHRGRLPRHPDAAHPSGTRGRRSISDSCCAAAT